jgi:hypothetical protein
MTAAVFGPTPIDPLVDPDLANQQVQALTAPRLPLMEALPANSVELPGGYIDDEGNLHTEARIREINGSDEEAMARELRNPSANVPKVVDLLLKRSVQSIGSIEPVPTQVLNAMLTGDRAALMLAVRILTFGSDWEVPDFPCRLCGEQFGTIVELDSIVIDKLDNPMIQEIEVELRNDHIATLALMTGAVQLEMVGDVNRTGPEEVTIAIDRCLRKIDGLPVAASSAQRMSMADRRTVVSALAEAQPGPRMEEVVVTCTECGREANYTVSLVDLFR